MDVEQCGQLLVEGELMSDEDMTMRVQAWQLEHDDTADGSDFIHQLVEQEVVTDFQGKAILAGLPGPYRLGPYRVFDRIVAGRLGNVFRAIHEEFNQPVSLKVFPAKLADIPERTARLSREARVAVQAEHANVVRCLQIGHAGENVFLAFEDLHGESLATRLSTKFKLPAIEACQLIREVTLGLAHLHANGTILRDIQPTNIWITTEGHAKLMEFGAARDALAHLESDQLTLTGSIDLLGDDDYMSPEQGANPHAADCRSDIYALGCVLFRCVTGEVLFPDDNPVRKMLRHAREPIRSPTQIDCTIPDALSDVLETMLAKAPKDRFQSAEDVAWVLGEIIASEEKLREARTEIDPEFLAWAESDSECQCANCIHTAIAEPEFLEFVDWIGDEAEENGGEKAEALPQEQEAVDTLRRMHAELRFDEDRHVRSVDFRLRHVRNSKLRCLRSLEKLETLALRQAHITDFGLAHLEGSESLKWLNLSGTRITDRGLNYLHGLRNLRWVFLENTRVTSRGMSRLQRAVPQCQIEK